MKNRKIIPLILSLSGAIFLSGCAISFNTGASGNNGGLFLSSDKGNTWTQKVLIPTVSGNPRSIGGLDMNDLAMDPSDNKALYLGSVNNGLFYSYDQAGTWQVSQSLGQINIVSVAVDPQSKCTIYASTANKLYKSVDCSRTWTLVYFDNDLNVSVSRIAIDNYNSANVYIGLTRGDILKSSDKGSTWKALYRFDDRIEKIVMNPNDTRIVFVGTRSKGLFRSNDGGNTWTDLNDNLKDFKDSNRVRDLAVSKTESGLVILANNYGLIRSTDNGNTWSKIDLITPEKEAIINAVTLNPANAGEIYYVTNTTFYRSSDGGKNWATKKLPTTRAGWRLIVDPVNPSMIYLAVRNIN